MSAALCLHSRTLRAQQCALRGAHGVCRFSAGLVLGGFLSAALGGGWQPTWALGMFDDVDSTSGRRESSRGCLPADCSSASAHGSAGGCTSGHGIFGLSNLELPSLVTTLSFMAGGIVTTHLIYRVLFS